MKRIDFSDWKQQKERVLQARIRTDSVFGGHSRGNRLRDPDKERILRGMDKARWERYLQSGKLVKLGPRRYRFRIDIQ